jgi:hypothetical protein
MPCLSGVGWSTCLAALFSKEGLMTTWSVFSVFMEALKEYPVSRIWIYAV